MKFKKLKNHCPTSYREGLKKGKERAREFQNSDIYKQAKEMVKE